MKHFRSATLEKKPALILCLGNVAVQSFFQNPEAEVKSLRGSWHDVQGFRTAVAYHPLAIRRRPNLRSLFLEDSKFVAERFNNFNAKREFAIYMNEFSFWGQNNKIAGKAQTYSH